MVIITRKHTSLLLLILFPLLPVFSHAQQALLPPDTELSAYLKSHATVFNINSDHDSVISTRMQGKRLLIYGEGGSHHLQVNGWVELKLLRILLPKSLKTYFVEAGRSDAFLDNLYIKGHYTFSKPFATGNSPDTIYNPLIQSWKDYFDAIKSYADNFPDFKMTGIDFERASNIYDAAMSLLGGAKYENVFLNEIRDTAYVHLSDKFNQQSKRFFKFYKRFKRDFDKDSTAIKLALNDSEKFRIFQYLFSNKNLSCPYQNRNRPMAANLLQEIRPILQANDSAITLLEIGQAHARPAVKGTVANILSESKILKGKILVINLFCENCHPVLGTSGNWGLKFMSDKAIYQAFENATKGKGDIVLFDLSDLPPKYASIKAYGNLLLFAKHQI